MATSPGTTQSPGQVSTFARMHNDCQILSDFFHLAKPLVTTPRDKVLIPKHLQLFPIIIVVARFLLGCFDNLHMRIKYKHNINKPLVIPVTHAHTRTISRLSFKRSAIRTISSDFGFRVSKISSPFSKCCPRQLKFGNFLIKNFQFTFDL